MIKEPFMAKAWCSKVLPKIKKGKKKMFGMSGRGKATHHGLGLRRLKMCLPSMSISCLDLLIMKKIPKPIT